MKLKTVDVNGTTYAEVADGKPVFILDDGREQPVDAANHLAKIQNLNKESQSHRERAEKAEGALKAFEGIEDPEVARKAIDFQKNAKDGEFVAAGKVEEMKAGLKRTFDEQYAASNKKSQEKIAELEKKVKDVTGRYNGEKISNAFAGSKFVREKLALPLEVTQKFFTDHFKIEDGKLIGYHAGGGPIMNLQGEHAGFDEAMEQIVAAYPNRDGIMRGTNSTGSGASANRGGNGSARTMSKAQFDAMPPPQQAALMTGADRPQLVD